MPARAEAMRAFALLYWAINLGVAIAGVAGGYLATRSYWLLFVLDAATCLVFAVLITRFVPETHAREARTDGHSYRVALHDGLLIGLVASIFIGSLVYLQSLVTLPLAVRADGHGPEIFGLVYAVNPITVIVLQPIVLWLIDRLPAVPLLAGSSVVMGVGFLDDRRGRHAAGLRAHCLRVDTGRDRLQRGRTCADRRHRTACVARPVQRDGGSGIRRSRIPRTASWHKSLRSAR
jgi:MFS family permease